MKTGESQKQRIARLTTLARKVWPDKHSVEVEWMQQTNSAYVTFEATGVDPTGTGEHLTWTAELVTFYNHPRALDALEAALCALAGEPPKWAAELAANWRTLRSGSSEMRHILDRCADELLEAAKGGAR